MHKTRWSADPILEDHGIDYLSAHGTAKCRKIDTPCIITEIEILLAEHKALRNGRRSTAQVSGAGFGLYPSRSVRGGGEYGPTSFGAPHVFS